MSARTAAGAVAARAAAECERVRREGAFTVEDERELARRFEEATVRALRVPAFAERAARLRQVARLLVPEAARPAARRAAGLADRALRRGYEILERRLAQR